jgi:hypothetical protein
MPPSCQGLVCTKPGKYFKTELVATAGLSVRALNQWL